MQYHAGWVKDTNGFVVDGVTVDVVADPAKPRGVKNRATLYADPLRTRPITNPFISGADGRFRFYTDNPGFAVMADKHGFTELEVLSGQGPVVDIRDFPGFDPTGTHDSAAPFNLAITQMPAGGILQFTPGRFLIGTPINLVNLQNKALTIQGAGRGDGLYDQHPVYGTNFYGRTGTQAVFETQGSHFVTLKDFGIYSMLADSDRSAIGIFIGRTTVQDFAQFHHYARINITLASKPTAHPNNRGAIAILNVGGEHGEFHHLFLIADTPLVASIVNPFGYVPTYGALGVNQSATMNNYYGCVFNSVTNWAMELWACQSDSFNGCYYGTITGASNLTTAVILRNSEGVTCKNLYFVGGQIEHWDNFLQADDGTSDITCDLTYAGPTATGPAVYINQAVNGKYYNWRVRFANPWGIEMPIISPGVATGVTLYGGELTLSNGIDLNVSSLTLQGTVIHDGDDTPNTALVAAPSTYLLANAKGVTTVDWINVRAYGGAVGDGVADDAAAIVAATTLASARGGGVVYFPPGTYKVGSALTIPDKVRWVGSAQGAAVIKRAFTGDFITASSYAQLENLTIEGDTATHGNGKGVLVGTGTINQWMKNVQIQNFNQPCVEFAVDGGSGFTAINSSFFTTGAVGSVGAITVNGTDTQAVPRYFFGCGGLGSTLFNVGGAHDFFVIGGFSNGMIFGAASALVNVQGMRFQAGTMTIDGDSHTIVGNVFGGAVTINADNIIFDGNQVPDYDITDNGTGNWVTFKRRDYTPTWTGSGSNPAIGNGTLIGTWSRDGNRVHVDVELKMGSTTTYGTGTWRWALPVPPRNTAGESWKVGPAHLYDDNATLVNVGVALSNPALSYVTIEYHGGAAGITPTTPWTWAQDDLIRFSIDYLVP